MLVFGLCSQARAAVIAYETPGGSSTGGQTVSAKATFTTASNQITILLENLKVDPRSVVQNLSGLLFTVNTGQNTGTITSSAGVERTVAGDETYTDGASVPAGWDLNTLGGSLELNVLGSGIGPAHTLIGLPAGSNTYADSNGSIKGNGPHNPFLGLSASWTLNIPGVTAGSSISAVTFRFGTAAGNDVNGIVPEPTAMALLVGVLAIFRRR